MGLEYKRIISTRSKIAEHRQWIYLLIGAIGVFLLFPQIIGFNRTLVLLGRTSPLFLCLVLVAEISRYILSASTTRVLGRLFQRRLPLEPLTEAFFAGSALNRTFSTGGAPGMLVRLLFLTKQHLSAGAVAVIFLIEDVAGFVMGSLILLAGILSLASAHPSERFIFNTAAIFVLGTAALALAGLVLYRHRTWVEKSTHWIVRALDRPVSWVIGRSLYTPDRVSRALYEFYAGMSLARRAPLFVLLVFALNLLRTIAGLLALYFAFLALGWTISPGVLVLLYTSASVLSTVSAVPGELAIMGGSWALLTFSFGVPRDIAVAALLLYRTVAFWLPIPVGYAALWNLRRRHYL